MRDLTTQPACPECGIDLIPEAFQKPAISVWCEGCEAVFATREPDSPGISFSEENGVLTLDIPWQLAPHEVPIVGLFWVISIGLLSYISVHWAQMDFVRCEPPGDVQRHDAVFLGE